MRFILCLILLLCFALAADAGPFRRASCSGGSCTVTPAPVPDAKPFSPLDLVMVPKEQRAVLPSQAVAAQPQACSGGQCSATPANRFGRVTVRVFRR
jgi:hypothetical protein